MTTRPVLRSTAITDHVAKAGTCEASRTIQEINIRHIEDSVLTGHSPEKYRRESGCRCAPMAAARSEYRAPPSCDHRGQQVKSPGRHSLCSASRTLELPAVPRRRRVVPPQTAE